VDNLCGSRVQVRDLWGSPCKAVNGGGIRPERNSGEKSERVSLTPVKGSDRSSFSAWCSWRARWGRSGPEEG
jgi:hypothetical protein